MQRILDSDILFRAWDAGDNQYWSYDKATEKAYPLKQLFPTIPGNVSDWIQVEQNSLVKSRNNNSTCSFYTYEPSSKVSHLVVSNLDCDSNATLHDNNWYIYGSCEAVHTYDLATKLYTNHSVDLSSAVENCDKIESLSFGNSIFAKTRHGSYYVSESIIKFDENFNASSIGENIEYWQSETYLIAYPKPSYFGEVVINNILYVAKPTSLHGRELVVTRIDEANNSSIEVARFEVPPTIGIGEMLSHNGNLYIENYASDVLESQHNLYKVSLTDFTSSLVREKVGFVGSIDNERLLISDMKSAYELRNNVLTSLFTLSDSTTMSTRFVNANEIIFSIHSPESLMRFDLHDKSFTTLDLAGAMQIEGDKSTVIEDKFNEFVLLSKPSETNLSMRTYHVAKKNLQNELETIYSFDDSYGFVDVDLTFYYAKYRFNKNTTTDKLISLTVGYDELSTKHNYLTINVLSKEMVDLDEESVAVSTENESTIVITDNPSSGISVNKMNLASGDKEELFKRNEGTDSDGFNHYIWFAEKLYMYNEHWDLSLIEVTENEDVVVDPFDFSGNTKVLIHEQELHLIDKGMHLVVDEMGETSKLTYSTELEQAAELSAFVHNNQLLVSKVENGNIVLYRYSLETKQMQAFFNQSYDATSERVFIQAVTDFPIAFVRLTTDSNGVKLSKQLIHLDDSITQLADLTFANTQGYELEPMVEQSVDVSTAKNLFLSTFIGFDQGIGYEMSILNFDIHQISLQSVPQTISLTANQQFTAPILPDTPLGENFSISFENLPDWVSYDSETSQLIGTAPTGIEILKIDDIKLVVTNLAMDSVVKHINIEVAAVNSPTISGEAVTQLYIGESYQFAPTASDPQGLGLVFSIENKPAWADFDEATGRLSGIAAEAGAFNDIVISVSNGYLMTSTEKFNIQVDAINAPIISGEAVTQLTSGDNYQFIPSASDPQGFTLVFSIENKPAWATFDTATGELSGTASVGTYTGITITVSNGYASTSLPSFDLTVNQAPVVEPKSSSKSSGALSALLVAMLLVFRRRSLTV